MRASALLVSIALFILGVGCWSNPGQRGEIAFQRDGDVVVLAILSCGGAGAPIDEVRLIEGGGATGARGPILWSIVGGRGAAAERVVPIGTTPSGFTEVTPLIGPLAESERYIVEVTFLGRRDLTLRRGFSLADLTETDWWLSGDRHVSEGALGSLDLNCQ